MIKFLAERVETDTKNGGLADFFENQLGIELQESARLGYIMVIGALVKADESQFNESGLVNEANLGPRPDVIELSGPEQTIFFSQQPEETQVAIEMLKVRKWEHITLVGLGHYALTDSSKAETNSRDTKTAFSAIKTTKGLEDIDALTIVRADGQIIRGVENGSTFMNHKQTQTSLPANGPSEDLKPS
jgi:hypothetical protein